MANPFQFTNNNDKRPQSSIFSSPANDASNSIFSSSVASAASPNPFSLDSPTGNRSLFAGTTPAQKSAVSGRGMLFNTNGKPTTQFAAPSYGGFGGQSGGSGSLFGSSARRPSPGSGDEDADAYDDEGNESYQDDLRDEEEIPTDQDEEDEDEDDTGMFGDEEDYDDTLQDGEDMDATPTKPTSGRGGGFVPEIAGPAKEPKELILKTEQLMEELASLISPSAPADDDEYDSDIDMDTSLPPPLELQEEYIRKYSKQFLAALHQAGPKSRAPRHDPLLTAYYICSLLLPLHHSTSSTAEVLRKWLYTLAPFPAPSALKSFKTFHPNYVCSTDFWPIIHHLTLRGEIHEVLELLQRGKWDMLCKDTAPPPAPGFQSGSSSAQLSKTRYTPAEVDAIKYAIEQAIKVLQKTPGKGRNSYQPPLQLFPPQTPALDSPGTPAEWRIYRGGVLKASTELRGVQPHDQRHDDTADETDDSYYAPASGGFGFGQSTSERPPSVKQLPAEFSRNLRVLYDILQGDRDTIISSSETWQEAVVAIMTWCREVDNLSDEVEDEDTAVCESDPTIAPGDYAMLRQRMRDRELQRLADVLMEIADSGDLPLDPTNPLEVAAGGVMASDPSIIKELSEHSLLAAAAVVEIGGYAGWVVRERESRSNKGSREDDVLNGFEEDEMQLLGISVNDRDSNLALLSPEMKAVAQDNEDVLRSYVASLMGTEWIDEKADVEGWEIAVGIIGRIHNSTQLAEELLPKIPTISPSRTSKLLDYCSSNPILAKTAAKIAYSFANDSLPTNAYGQRLYYLSRCCTTDGGEPDADLAAQARDEIHIMIQTLISRCLQTRSSYPPSPSTMKREDASEQCDETLASMLSSPAAVTSHILRMELAGYASLRRWYDAKDVAALVGVIRAAGEQLDGGIWDREWGCNVDPRWIPALGREFCDVLARGPASGPDEEQCLEVVRVLGDWEMTGKEVLAAAEKERDGPGLVEVKEGWERRLRLGVARRLASVWVKA